MRLAVVDDQALVLQGISELLEAVDDFEVVLRAASGDEFLELLDTTQVDLVVMDVRMPGRNGPDTTRELNRQDGPPPVLLLTTFDDEGLFRASVAAGARGFMLKDAGIDDLERAIRRIFDGGTYLAPVSGQGLAMESNGIGVLAALTERELDVLRLMAGGYANREIAHMLHLAEGTVKNHVSAVLQKLGSRDRTRAVLRAIGLRLI